MRKCRHVVLTPRTYRLRFPVAQTIVLALAWCRVQNCFSDWRTSGCLTCFGRQLAQTRNDTTLDRRAARINKSIKRRFKKQST